MKAFLVLMKLLCLSQFYAPKITYFQFLSLRLPVWCDMTKPILLDCWNELVSLLFIYIRGHQRGAHGHQVVRKNHVGRPRACSKNNISMINVFTLTNISTKIIETKLSKIFISEVFMKLVTLCINRYTRSSSQFQKGWWLLMYMVISDLQSYRFTISTLVFILTLSSIFLTAVQNWVKWIWKFSLVQHLEHTA